MALNFFFDTLQFRATLTEFVNSMSNARLLTERGSSPWNGILPLRTGDYFYPEPWVLCPGVDAGPEALDLSVFQDTDTASFRKRLQALQRLANLEEWVIFPWGGNANYGMLGQIVRDGVKNRRSGENGLFQYDGIDDFSNTYHGVIGRRTRSDFAQPLWQAIHENEIDILVVTFEYYADAFADSKAAFSVEGTISNGGDGPNLSVYRVKDLASFRYFVGLINAVQVFQLLPGDLSLDSCQTVRRLINHGNLSGALEHTRWFVVCNEGEIDTYPVLFAASSHERVARFVTENRDSLNFATFF